MAFHAYENRERLAEALATGVAAVLAGGIATRGSAVLAVSGGSTPKRFFERLSQAEIDWGNVTVTLVDERFVLPGHERSNAGLVGATLLQNRAKAARFLPMVTQTGSFADNLEEITLKLSLLGPVDAVVLGMGSDGHTASFFPGGDQLAKALDPAGKSDVLSMNAPGAGEPRLTLTLRRLLEAHFLALHIEGDEKREVYEKALGGGSESEMPVRAVLRRATERLQISWAP